MALWIELLERAGPDPSNAICLLSNAPPEMEQLRAAACEHFGDRCVIDPNDDSPETRLLMYDDLQRTLQHRGTYTEWIPYEIWTANNARRWAEGLRRELAARGYALHGPELTIESCGQQWGGCLTKYSAFIGKYLGLDHPVDVNAALSPNAGFPIKAQFVERVPMGGHVWLFLFETADGLPMAQYVDGLRAVWEPPHCVRVPCEPRRLNVITTTPNGFIKVDERAQVLNDAVIADVGDGCHPAFTTLIATDMTFEAFHAAVASGEVFARDDRRRISYNLPYADPATASRDPT